jgi:hypothetical protein
MPDLRPLHSISEHDIINGVFTYSGSLPVKKGTFVKVVGSGWRTHESETDFLGSVGASYGNILSQRFGVKAKVAIASTGDVAIGMLMNDVREVDEHGNKLVFDPEKTAEMQAVLSGQAVPIITRGVFLYSGVAEAVTAGATAYVSGGQLTPTNVNVGTGTVEFHGSRVGTFLGAKDDNGWVLVKINCQ